ncbi:MAG TPA: HAD family hydrolase, partial [Holophaga sp.]|nr:HAD family hydrolase [Holophaga sp.]
VYAHSMIWLAGISEHFDALVTRDLVQAGKPSPEIYLKAASMLGCAPEECLAFEDSPTGIEAALAAGMPVVMVPDLIPPTDELRARCAAVFPSLGEAAKALEGLIRRG